MAANSTIDPWDTVSTAAPAPMAQADPWDAVSTPAPPQTAPPTPTDPWDAISAPAAAVVPPLSEGDFQSKMKTRWGAMLSGDSTASPTDLAEMQASGKFTPEQLQRIQTETTLRQTYTDQQAQTLGQKAQTAGSAALSGLGSMAQDLLVVPRVAQAAGELSANNPGVGSTAARVGNSVLEGGSEAATGILGLAKGLATGPAKWIKGAYDQVTGAAPNAEQDYQNWKLDYLKTHAVPGYAPPSTSSRSQDLESAISGKPAESIPAPVAPLTSLASTWGTLPLYAGAGKVAGEVLPKALAATGLSESAPTLSKLVTPVPDAEKVRDAMNDAVAGKPGPSQPALSQVTDAVADKAGKVVSGIGNAATGLAERINAIPGVNSNVAQLLASSIVGPKPVMVVEGVLKALEKLGPKAADVGDAMSRIATASPNDPFGRLMAVASDADAPPLLRKWAQNPAIQFAYKAGTLAGGAVKGFTKGAATGAGISLVSGDSPEEVGQNIAGMGLFGAIHGGMSEQQTRVLNANIGAVSKFISDSLANGTSPETLRMIPASDIFQAALWNKAQPAWKTRFATALDQGSPFAPAGTAFEKAGWSDPDTKTNWIDPTKGRAPGATTLHENFHPIFDNLVTSRPEIVNAIDSALAKNGHSIQDFKQEYADAVTNGDTQASAAYIADKDAHSPDWGYSEMLSESAAHNLEGKDLLSVMQKGTPVEQTATQAALAGVSGWLNDMGVDLQKNAQTGTIFPNFTDSFNDPALRSLTHKLLKVQRESVLGNVSAEAPATPVTPADMGRKKAPYYPMPGNVEGNAYGRVVTNNKGVQEFKAWPASEIRKRAVAETEARKKYFPTPGQTTTAMPAGLDADPNITPWTKQALKSIFDSIANKSNLSLFYHRLNSENSATAKESRATDIGRHLGNVQVSWQSGKPVGVEMTKKGNLIVRWESQESENQRLHEWAQRHGPVSLDLWGSDIAKAKADIQTYLDNHATGQPGDANGIGVDKKNVINALLAGSNKEFEATNPLRAQLRKSDRAGIMRSLRVDRMESAQPESSDRAPAQWENLKRNLSPGAETEEKQESGKLYSGQFSPSTDPGAVKTAAIYDRQNERTYEGMIHAVAWDNYLNDARYGKNKSPYKLKDGSPRVEEGFTTNDGEFLDRQEALERAAFLNQYKPTAVNKTGNLEAFEFQKQQGVSKKTLMAQFSPAQRDIELTGPDGTKYPAKYGGIQETLDPKNPWLTITPMVDLPGATVAKSTTFAHSLAKKGYSVPPELLDELKTHIAAQQQFSPSANPDAIAAAAVRDKDGRIFAGASHVIAAAKSPKAPQDLEDGFVTNSGEFVTQEKAMERAIAANQYKPGGDDYNADKIRYGLTSERFNKQNPSTEAGVGRANDALDKIQPQALRPGIEPAVRWKGKVYTNAELDKLQGSNVIDKLKSKGVLKASDWTDVDYDDETKPSGYLIEHGFADKKGKWVKAKNAYQTPASVRPAYSPTVEAKNVRTPDQDIRDQVSEYTTERGLTHEPFTGYAPLNEDLGKRVADAYEAAPHIPNDPKVQASYKAVAEETRAQWDFLTKKGVTFEPWTAKGQPYESSADMRKDVQKNKHLWFFPTAQGFGEGEESTNNPMLAPTGITVDKVPLVANDLFRAVHDYFGHAKEGYEFGPRGEYNAYLAHSRMFSDAALPALTAETMGQNSWVNFGKHLRDEAGNIPKKGEAGYVAPQDRPFADQKATTLPDELVKESVAPAANLKNFSPAPLITSLEFKNWFGDWEDPKAFSSRRDASKPPVSVVVKNGKPLILYHGTNAPFDNFDKSKKGVTNFGWLGEFDTQRHGIFATDSPEFANEFISGKEDNGKNIRPLYMNLKSPMDLTHGLDDIADELKEHGINPKWVRNVRHPWELFDEEDGNAFVDAAKKAGYDGAIFEEPDSEGKASKTYVAFDNNQVKSALSPQFSPVAADPTYSSKLKDTVEDKFSGKVMPAAQLAAILRSPKNGVKDDYMVSGLPGFLKGRTRVNKTEVKDFLSIPVKSSPPDTTNYPEDIDEWGRGLLHIATRQAINLVESHDGEPLETKIVGSVLNRRDPKDIDVAIKVADVTPFIGKKVPSAIDSMVGGFPVDTFLTDGKNWAASGNGSFISIEPDRKLRRAFKLSTTTIKPAAEDKNSLSPSAAPGTGSGASNIKTGTAPHFRKLPRLVAPPAQPQKQSSS